MKILGIETSCDETAAAVVEDGRRVLSSVIASQVKMHARTGGVVPEVAAREHVVKIVPVIEEALLKAGVSLDSRFRGNDKRRGNDIDAIAVTQGPGLISSLLVGTNMATTLTRVLEKPLIPVNHIEGHIYANWLERGAVELPAMVLTVSGGHNELILMKEHGVYEEVGTTLDDAAGEAFDKVARLLGLGYPGGPAISKAAEKGDPERFKLPRAWLKPSYNFSFSGLKTAVIREMEKAQGKVTEKFKRDLAASFQEAVVEVLAEKVVSAAADSGAGCGVEQSARCGAEKGGAAAGGCVREIHLAGGVSANQSLREKIQSKITAKNLKTTFQYPAKIEYCTDNAAMIAGAAYFKYQNAPQKYQRWKNIIAQASFSLI